MSTDIHWFAGDTIVTRHLPADSNGPELKLISIHPGARHQTTLFMEPAFAKALRDALDALYPPVEENTLVERYAEEHAPELEAHESAPPTPRPPMSEVAKLIFDTANAMNRAYLAGMHAGGAK